MAVSNEFGGFIVTPAPVSVSAAGDLTLSAAQTLNGLITTTGLGIAQAITTASAADLFALYPAVSVGAVLGSFSIRDTDQPGAVTVTGGTNCSIVGSNTVLALAAGAVSGSFLVVKTGLDAAVAGAVTIYRVA
jgi:hypothetical protein